MRLQRPGVDFQPEYVSSHMSPLILRVLGDAPQRRPRLTPGMWPALKPNKATFPFREKIVFPGLGEGSVRVALHPANLLRLELCQTGCCSWYPQQRIQTCAHRYSYGCLEASQNALKRNDMEWECYHVKLWHQDKQIVI